MIQYATSVLRHPGAWPILKCVWYPMSPSIGYYGFLKKTQRPYSDNHIFRDNPPRGNNWPENCSIFPSESKPLNIKFESADAPIS